MKKAPAWRRRKRDGRRGWRRRSADRPKAQGGNRRQGGDEGDRNLPGDDPCSHSHRPPGGRRRPPIPSRGRRSCRRCPDWRSAGTSMPLWAPSAGRSCRASRGGTGQGVDPRHQAEDDAGLFGEPRCGPWLGHCDMRAGRRRCRRRGDHGRVEGFCRGHRRDAWRRRWRRRSRPPPATRGRGGRSGR